MSMQDETETDEQFHRRGIAAAKFCAHIHEERELYDRLQVFVQDHEGSIVNECLSTAAIETAMDLADQVLKLAGQRVELARQYESLIP